MKRHVVVFAVVAVLGLVALAVVVPRLLRGPDGDPLSDAASPPAAGTTAGGEPGAGGSGEVAARPDCPAGAVAGVDLDCLGGAAGTGELSADGPVVVNVWAWWCAPCREELPVFAEFAKAHPDYRVVGVHADRDAARGAALLEDLGVDLPSFQDSDGVFQARLSLPAVVPVTLLVEGSEVRAVHPRAYDQVEQLEADLGLS